MWTRCVLFCAMFLAATVQLRAQVPVTITVNGGINSRGAMTLWIDSYSMTIRYGEFSTAASIAANFGGRVSLDSSAPVWAKGFTDGTIKMKLRHGGSVSNIHVDVTPDGGSGPGGGSGGGSGSPPIVVSTNPGGVSGGTPPSGSSVYSYTIAGVDGTSGYDPVGNIIAFSDSVNGQWTAGYDSLNRLSSASQSSMTTQFRALWGNANAMQQSLCWKYDSFGNRLLQAASKSSFVDLGNCVGADEASTSYSFANVNSNNQITNLNYTYDAAGNLTGDGLYTYQYDGAGRLCAMYKNVDSEMVGYLYDGDGNRVAKGTIKPQTGNWCDFATNGFTLTSRYVLGPDGQTLTEFDSTGRSHSNISLAGGVAATLTATTTTQTITHLNFTDWLGTRRVQTDVQGNTEQACTSSAFGDALNCIGQDAAPNHFTGKERDTESGLDYFGARYYGSSMGRFVSPDPSGIAYGNPYNPQSLNLYSYVLNNPLRFVDPTGLYCAWEDGTSDDDPNDGGASHSDCDSQGGRWTDQSNPCHGADGCVATFDWNQPQTQNVAFSGLIGGGGQVDMRQLMLRYLRSCEGHAPGGGFGAYNDSMGFCTTGYGQLLHRSPCTAQDYAAHRGETQGQAEARLEQDYDQANQFIQNSAPDSTQGQRNAFVDMTFNMGTGSPGGTHGMVNHDAWTDFTSGNNAAVPGDIMSLTAGGPGIRTRRGNEVNMWNGGAPPATCY